MNLSLNHAVGFSLFATPQVFWESHITFEHHNITITRHLRVRLHQLVQRLLTLTSAGHEGNGPQSEFSKQIGMWHNKQTQKIVGMLLKDIKGKAPFREIHHLNWWAGFVRSIETPSRDTPRKRRLRRNGIQDAQLFWGAAFRWRTGSKIGEDLIFGSLPISQMMDKNMLGKWWQSGFSWSYKL